MNIKSIIKILFFPWITLFLFPFKHLVRKKRVIILQTYNRHFYCDNTRYLYEFLSKKDDLEVYWVTDDKRIKQSIANNGWKYISWNKPFHMIYVALKAKVIIDNGDSFFNPFNITNTKKTIKICLQHGCGPKIIARGKDIETSIRQIKKFNSFDYVNFPSKFSAEYMGKNMYCLPDKKIISLGYPRCDQFFNKALVSKSFKAKKIATKIIPGFTPKDKIILYTPTWRPYNYDSFPLTKIEGFNLKKFNKWLEDNNMFLCCSFHSKSKANEKIGNDNRVIFLDREINYSFDLNQFMMEVDVLLNDFSTTSTDFALLDRPQIFFMPDYDEYSASKGFFEDYRNTLNGAEVFTYKELINTLDEILANEVLYKNKFLENHLNLMQKYYDSYKNKSCEESYKLIIDELEKGVV